MISAGKYSQAKIVDASFGETQNGVLYVSITWKTLSGEEVEWRGWLSGKAEVRTWATLAELGKHDASDDFSACLGRTASITVVVEEYNDKEYPKVQWINVAQAATGSMLDRLRASRERALAGAGQRPQQQRPQQQRPQQQRPQQQRPAPQSQWTGDDDDIPF